MEKLKAVPVRAWVVLGSVVLIFFGVLPLVELMGDIFCLGDEFVILIIMILLYVMAALIAYFITIVTRQPKLEVLKSVSGVFFVGGSFPPLYNWPLYFVSIAAAVLYLAKLKHTNGRKTSVIVYLVLSCLGLVMSWWLLKIVLF